MKSRSTNLNRRRICQLLAGLAGIAASRGAFATGGIAALQRGGLEGLNGLLSSERSARIIGERYLKLRPQEADTAVLKKLVFRDVESVLELPNLPQAQWRSMLRVQVTQDFSAGRTVNLDGWILAETECRLCALVACVG